MKALLKRRFLFAGLPLVLVAAVAGTVLATGPVSAAGPPKPVAGHLTIYSETFLPYTRTGDGDSLQHVRYIAAPGPDTLDVTPN